MKAAYIYLRVSTEEQATEGFSLAAQERACRLYCELHGYEVAGLYRDDGYTGKNDRRPGLQALLAAVRPQALVIVHKLDRFARNTRLLLDTVERFEGQQISLVSVTEQLDFSSPMGKVFVTLLAAFGQYYVDNLATETSKGLREKARGGHWVGSVPFGYRKVDKSTIEPSEDAPAVQLIYELYASGGYNFHQLADEMNARGLQMYDWQSKQHGPFTREAVRVILGNPAYLGKVRCAGEEIIGKHQPLVTPEVWAQVQALRGARTKHTGPEAPRKVGKYKKRLYCASCSSLLWFRYGGHADTPSYECSGKRRGKCDVRQVSEAAIERELTELMALFGEPLEALQSFIVAVWLEGVKVVAVKPKAKYRALFAKLGFEVRG